MYKVDSHCKFFIMGVLSSNRDYPYNILGLTVEYSWLWWVAKLIFRMFTDVYTTSIVSTPCPLCPGAPHFNSSLWTFAHTQTWQNNSLSAFTVCLVHNYGGSIWFHHYKYCTVLVLKKKKKRLLIVLIYLITVPMFSMTCHIWGGGGARFCWRTLRLKGMVCEMKSSTLNRYYCSSSGSRSGKAWWTYLVNVNYRHGRRFARFTQEGRKMREGSLPLVFHVPRKRRHNTLVIFWLKVVKVACINMQLFPKQSVCLCLTFWR